MRRRKTKVCQTLAAAEILCQTVKSTEKGQTNGTVDHLADHFYNIKCWTDFCLRIFLQSKHHFMSTIKKKV